MQATNVQEFRSLFPAFTGLTGLGSINYSLPITPGIKNTHKTGLTPVAAYQFTGSEFSSTDRYPQSVAAIGNFILAGFYFNALPLKDAAKLVVINRGLTTPAAGNLGLLQRQAGGLYGRINTHAGGMEIFAGRYLFVENSYLGCAHVFDLQSVYPKAGNEAFIDTADTYSNQFDHFLPEVGRITFNATTNLNSLSKCGEDLVLSNFWIAGSQYSAGGKTFVWRLPLDDTTYEFPAPLLTTVAEEFIPIMPANTGAEAGLFVDKVQGVLWMENGVVMLSRSYGSGTKNLTILYKHDSNVFYNGNSTYPSGYDWKNWLYGCEDLSLTDNDEVITITEFIGWRDVTVWRLNDLLGLVNLPLPPTIAEHQANLFALLDHINTLTLEADFYQSQITSAIAENLERFDRATYVPSP